MYVKRLSLVVFALIGLISAPAFAADDAPLDLGPAEALKYWKPKEGAFSPETRADPARVAFAEDVTVGYTVTKRGRTKDVYVIEAKPAGASVEWALNAVKAMRFEPTESNPSRQPVRSQLSTHWSSGGAADKP